MARPGRRFAMACAFRPIRMALSTARNALAGIDSKLDPAMAVNREVLCAPVLRGTPEHVRDRKVPEDSRRNAERPAAAPEIPPGAVAQEGEMSLHLC